MVKLIFIYFKGGDVMRDFIIEVWGDFACFTRPETKVERFSYPVMTPSAARGILDAIYSKPLEFGWRINSIEVINPIKFIALRRNEVKEKISEAAVKKAIKGGEAPLIIADDTGNDQRGRTQRQTIALKDVRYRIHGYIQPRRGYEDKIKALEEQAARRIQNGKCFYQPYFGCREFAAYFGPAEDDRPPIEDSLDLGFMIYDVFNLDEVVIDTAGAFISLFKAELKNGVLHIPAWDSPLVKKPK